MWRPRMSTWSASGFARCQRPAGTSKRPHRLMIDASRKIPYTGAFGGISLATAEDRKTASLLSKFQDALALRHSSFTKLGHVL